MKKRRYKFACVRSVEGGWDIGVCINVIINDDQEKEIRRQFTKEMERLGRRPVELPHIIILWGLRNAIEDWIRVTDEGQRQWIKSDGKFNWTHLCNLDQQAKGTLSPHLKQYGIVDIKFHSVFRSLHPVEGLHFTRSKLDMMVVSANQILIPLQKDVVAKPNNT